MKRSRSSIRGALLARLALACALTATSTVGVACTNGAVDPEESARDTVVRLDSPYDGDLMYVSGSDLYAIDGSTARVTELGELEGEIGWSGFIRLTRQGSVVYEGLDSGMPTLRLRSSEGADSVVLEAISAVHDFDGESVLASDSEDLHLIDVDSRSTDVRRMGVGPCLSAALSQDGSEVAYAQGIAERVPGTQGGELEQRLMIAPTDGSGDASETIRGWYAIEPILLDSDSLLFANYPFGGSEAADLVLVDRGSNESTTVASSVTILDVDRDSRSVAIATSTETGEPGDGVLSVLFIDGERTVKTTVFEAMTAGVVTAARIRPEGAGLVAAIAHPDGVTSLVTFDGTSGVQGTVTEWPDTYCGTLLVHPDGMIVFAVLEAPDTVTPTIVNRSIALCDLAKRTGAELLPADTRDLVLLAGVR